jgi:hypothetical protein
VIYNDIILVSCTKKGDHRRKFKVKLPTIWTDEKQRRAEAERRG